MSGFAAAQGAGGNGVVPDGAVTAPGIRGSDADSGIYFDPAYGGERSINLAFDGVDGIKMRKTLWELDDALHIRWNVASPNVGISHPASGVLKVTDASTGVGKLWAGTVEIDTNLDHDGAGVGFYGTAPVAKQTGVAVTAEAIHAALVALGLIAA